MFCKKCNDMLQNVKALRYKDGKLVGYQKGFEMSADGSVKAAKVLKYEEGKSLKNLWMRIISFF